MRDERLKKVADCENAEGNEEVGSQNKIKTKTGAQNQSVIARSRGNDEAISLFPSRFISEIIFSAVLLSSHEPASSSKVCAGDFRFRFDPRLDKYSLIRKELLATGRFSDAQAP